MREIILKRHYINYHMINEDDAHFKDLFTPDTHDQTCKICQKKFDSARSKKMHMFLFHYGTSQQIGGRGPGTSDLPLNILRRGPIPYYSITFDQHKLFYDFFSTGLVDDFLNSTYQVYRSDKENKIQGYVEIINQQYDEVILEDTRVLLTNTFTSKHFSDFVRGELKDEITKRVVVNGQTGSSWHFKRFERLKIIVTSLSDAKRILSS